MPEFTFVNVKTPDDAQKLAKESEIRSHVARHQWKQVTTGQTNSRKRKNNNSQVICVAQARPPAPYARVWMASGGGRSSGSNRSGRRRARNSGQEEKDSSQPEEIPDDEIVRTQPPLLMPTQLGGLRVDPFRSYPIPLKPAMPMLVDHYLMSMAVDIPELDQPGNKGLLRTSWFPLVMTDQALFLVIMLLAASHYASVQPISAKTRLNLLSLRYEAVQAINSALEGQKPEELSDAMVGAIAKMASYEAMFGTMENYNLHMSGLRRIVALRGGLTTLGLSGLLRRMVVWIDRNARFLIRSTLYFPGATFAPGQPLPDPNPGHFLGHAD